MEMIGKQRSGVNDFNKNQHLNQIKQAWGEVDVGKNPQSLLDSALKNAV